MTTMSREFHELDGIRVDVAPEVRERQLGTITRALRVARAPRRRRFRLLALATAIVLALPVIALGAEDSVPGDLLYPVKRIIEPLVSVFDHDVSADHRVEEAELLFERGAEARVVQDHVALARDTIADSHPEHAERLDRVSRDLEARIIREQMGSDVPAPGDDPAARGDDRPSDPAEDGVDVVPDQSTTTPDGTTRDRTSTTLGDTDGPTTSEARRDG